MINKWLNFVQSFFFQFQPCVLCEQEVGLQKGWVICRQCLKNLPWLDASSPNSPNTDPTQVMAVLDYRDPIKKMIQQYKYGKKLFYARTFAGLIYEQVMATNNPLPQLLIPVPLSAQRLKARGFNQALEIARFLSRYTSVPIFTEGCYRVRDTPMQARLNLQQRQSNLQNAFTIKLPSYLQGKLSHVAIIDDVFTTGATVHALSDVLKTQGITRVDAWVLCKTSKS